MIMALGGGLALLKAGVRAFIVGDWTTVEYVAGIVVRCDASHQAQSSSSSVTSIYAKPLSRFWLTGASGVPVLMICWLLVTSHT